MKLGDIARSCCISSPPLIVKVRANAADIDRLSAIADRTRYPFPGVPVHVDESLPPGVWECDYTDGSVKRLRTIR